MHETAVLRSVLREIHRITAQEGAAHVSAVRVRLGALSHLDEAHFREHFAVEARDSPAAHARVEVELSTDIHDPDAPYVKLISIELSDEAAPEPDAAPHAAHPHPHRHPHPHSDPHGAH